MQPLTARFVPYGIRGGQENMAIDEYLLLRHGHAGVPVLRLYGWNPPAISLGRYQGIECLDRDACLGDGVTVVRRITGGGAIFHDHELTYSVLWPAGNPDTHESNAGSFKKINAFIMETYRSLGINPVYAKDAGRESPPGRLDFCFSGNEDYDILIEGRKIGGNAQRRVRGALLQHAVPVVCDVAIAANLLSDACFGCHAHAGAGVFLAGAVHG
jgi:lipoate-protein ligase A